MSLMIVCLYSGPQPGWDPDIVAALEAAETSNTLKEDELEDDFVTMVRLLPSTCYLNDTNCIFLST